MASAVAHAHHVRARSQRRLTSTMRSGMSSYRDSAPSPSPAWKSVESGDIGEFEALLVRQMLFHCIEDTIGRRARRHRRGHRYRRAARAPSRCSNRPPANGRAAAILSSSKSGRPSTICPVCRSRPPGPATGSRPTCLNPAWLSAPRLPAKTKATCTFPKFIIFSALLAGLAFPKLDAIYHHASRGRRGVFRRGYFHDRLPALVPVDCARTLNGIVRFAFFLVLLVVVLIVVGLAQGDGLPGKMVLSLDLRHAIADSSPLDFDFRAAPGDRDGHRAWARRRPARRPGQGRDPASG